MADGRKYAKKDDELMPSIFDHCVLTYKTMLTQSRGVVNINGSAELRPLEEKEPQGQIIVYEGFLTALVCQDLRFSVPYYTSIRRALKEMGCIRQLKRGGGTSPSQWEMITEPTPRLFNTKVPKREVQPSRHEVNEQRIRELISTVEELRDTVNAINEFLAGEFGTEG